MTSSLTHSKLERAKIKDIPVESWVNGELEYSFDKKQASLIIETDECSTSYAGNILLHKQELMQLIKDTMEHYNAFAKQRKASLEPSYQSPYMQLLKEAIIEHKITVENQPPNKVLVSWFEEKLRSTHSDIKPKNKAKLLATFVRMPESQKGGLRKTKPKG